MDLEDAKCLLLGQLALGFLLLTRPQYHVSISVFPHKENANIILLVEMGILSSSRIESTPADCAVRWFLP